MERGGLIRGQFDELPWQPVCIQIRHEGIGIELLDVPNTRAAPMLRENLSRPDHGRDACGIGNGLRADLREAFLVIADVVNVDCLGFAAFETRDDVADAGAAFGGLAEISGIWQNRLKKL